MFIQYSQGRLQIYSVKVILEVVSIQLHYNYWYT